MKILFSVYDYFPLQNATANCIENLIAEIYRNDKNANIDVLTYCVNPDDPIVEIHNQTTIHRMNNIKIIRKEAYYSYCKGQDFSQIKKLLYCCRKLLYKLRIQLSRTPCKVLDKEILFHLVRLHKENKYDAIINVAGEFSFVFAGIRFKKLFDNVIVYSYLTDPLLGNYNFHRYNQERLKRDQDYIFYNSDKVFVTPIIYEHIEKKEKKIVSIEFPSFFEHESVTNREDNIIYEKDRINMLYTGIFVHEIREPDYMVDLLMKTNHRITLHICGQVNDAFKRKYNLLINEKRIVLHGNIDHERLYNAIIEADSLINIGNKTNMMLPSKLISYISTGKPIINFYQIDDCPTLTYLKKYKNRLNISQKKPMQENLSLIRKFLNIDRQEETKEEIMAHYKECTVEYIVNKAFGELINKGNK